MKRIFFTALGKLTKSDRIFEESERRQAELLAKILIFLLGFCVVILFIVLFLNPHNDPQYKTYVLQISGLVAFFAASYGLNYFGYYKPSAFLLVVSAALTPWISLTFDSSIFEGDFVPLTYLAFSVLMSSILLTTLITSILAVLQISGLVILYVIYPSILVHNWFSFLAFVILTSIFSILANNIIQNNFKKIDSLVHKLEKNEAHLLELSNRDYLTNLYNRRYLEDSLAREIHRSKRGRLPLGVIIIDIDDFKNINDTFGHSAGDLVLQEISKYLSNHVRKSDIVCRYGGDEFVLILTESSKEVIIERVENLHQGVLNLSVEHHQILIDSLTLSVGVADYPGSGSTVEQLLKAADTALYQAKRNGGNRVELAR
jgi:diguanylate cyclase (GGDEF)-like protein